MLYSKVTQLHICIYILLSYTYLYIVLCVCTCTHTHIYAKNEYVYILLFFFCLFRATPATYGGSQAKGLIGAIAAGLHHSHGNARSKPCLQPTSQLMAMPDP